MEVNKVFSFNSVSCLFICRSLINVQKITTLKKEQYKFLIDALILNLDLSTLASGTFFFHKDFWPVAVYQCNTKRLKPEVHFKMFYTNVQ